MHLHRPPTPMPLSHHTLCRSSSAICVPHVYLASRRPHVCSASRACHGRRTLLDGSCK
ncbi:hypothetical protein B0H34DRAFT_685375 [Crassisporium funariophilum]|nr:hypothetical protein B0H34DRAFT_685375 [Crassisporium funariophilum]